MVPIQVRLPLTLIISVVLRNLFSTNVLGFHEGVANAVILSVFNPVHLRRVGLFNNNTEIYESNINFLLLMALKKVAYAPFAYLVDQVLLYAYIFILNFL